MWTALILLGSVAFLINYLLNSKNNFWKEYGVKQIQNSNLFQLGQSFLGMKPLADFDHVAYQEMEKTGDKFLGVVELTQPILIVKDLEIVKKILIKDFDHFVDHRTFAAASQKIAQKMLFNMTGEEWKEARTQVSPTFTTGKIRRMMEHVNGVGTEWVEHLKENIAKNGGGLAPIPVHKEATHYTTDVIAAAVFGMKSGVIRNPDSYFSKMVHKLGDFGPLDILKFGITTTFPKLATALDIKVFDQNAVDFFTSIFTEGMKARKEGKVKSNDFIQLLVEASKGEIKSAGSDELSEFEKDAQLKGASGKKSLDELTATAQALQFFFAGFSTISNNISFIMYMLALNPDVQKKLREEVNSKLFTKGDNEEVDYDVLSELPYLDMVICEVLRKYPPLDRLDRMCVKDYHDPSENLRVPKGAMVAIPLRSIHNDKRFYDHPDKFYPEHFTPEAKANRNIYSFSPFGQGPRNCIGMRFALVESKAAIAHIVHNFIIEPTANTPIPVKVKSLGPGVQVPDNLELGFKLAK